MKNNLKTIQQILLNNDKKYQEYQRKLKLFNDLYKFSKDKELNTYSFEEIVNSPYLFNEFILSLSTYLYNNKENKDIIIKLVEYVVFLFCEVDIDLFEDFKDISIYSKYIPTSDDIKALFLLIEKNLILKNAIGDITIKTTENINYELKTNNFPHLMGLNSMNSEIFVLAKKYNVLNKEKKLRLQSNENFLINYKEYFKMDYNYNNVDNIINIGYEDNNILFDELFSASEIEKTYLDKNFQNFVIEKYTNAEKIIIEYIMNNHIEVIPKKERFDYNKKYNYIKQSLENYKIKDSIFQKGDEYTALQKEITEKTGLSYPFTNYHMILNKNLYIYNFLMMKDQKQIINIEHINENNINKKDKNIYSIVLASFDVESRANSLVEIKDNIDKYNEVIERMTTCINKENVEFFMNNIDLVIKANYFAALNLSEKENIQSKPVGVIKAIKKDEGYSFTTNLEVQNKKYSEYENFNNPAEIFTIVANNNIIFQPKVFRSPVVYMSNVYRDLKKLYDIRERRINFEKNLNNLSKNSKCYNLLNENKHIIDLYIKQQQILYNEIKNQNKLLFENIKNIKMYLMNICKLINSKLLKGEFDKQIKKEYLEIIKENKKTIDESYYIMYDNQQEIEHKKENNHIEGDLYCKKINKQRLRGK